MLPGQDINFQQQLAQLQAQLNQMMQPTMAQPAVAPQKTEDFPTVAGLDGARSFYDKMLAGQKRVVWDSEKALFYVLQKDANGVAQRIQIGTFTLAPEPSMEDKYVTREDFNLLVSKLDGILNPKEAKTNA